MNHLEKLKKTFDEIGVPYIIEESENGYVTLYICSEEEMKINRREISFGRDVFFEFCNGDLASSP